MRRLLWIMLIFVALGCVVSVVVAWLCAWRSSPAEFDPLVLADLRRSFFRESDRRSSPGQTQSLWVDMAQPGIGVRFASVSVEAPGVGGINHNSIDVVRAGWPVIALEGREYFNSSRAGKLSPMSEAGISIRSTVTIGRSSVSRILPLRPLWPGFLASMLVWGAALFGSWMAFRGVLRVVRFLRRRCIACGYPLGVSPVCTECGHPIRFTKWRHRGASPAAKLDA